jgi:hypothetical protein
MKEKKKLQILAPLTAYFSHILKREGTPKSFFH